MAKQEYKYSDYPFSVSKGNDFPLCIPLNDMLKVFGKKKIGIYRSTVKILQRLNIFLSLFFFFNQRSRLQNGIYIIHSKR